MLVKRLTITRLIFVQNLLVGKFILTFLRPGTTKGRKTLILNLERTVRFLANPGILRVAIYIGLLVKS